MIFLIYNNRYVDVYESLNQVSKMVEWQDILDNSLIILDEDGNTYAWDSSKENELGIVYEYSFKLLGENKSLLKRCKQGLNKSANKNEFDLSELSL